MTSRSTVVAVLTMLLVAACSNSSSTKSRAGTPATFTVGELAVFAPLPPLLGAREQRLDEARTALGRTLFYETALSESHEISCNSCHALDAWGVDGRKVSVGHKGQVGTRNAPSVYNAAGQFAQFWDGRAKDVEAQATGPILNPIEMAMPDSEAVLAHLRTAKSYVASFRAAFPGEK